MPGYFPGDPQLLLRHHQQLQVLAPDADHHAAAVDVHRLGGVGQHAPVPVHIQFPVAQQLDPGHAGGDVHRQLQALQRLLAHLGQLLFQSRHTVTSLRMIQNAMRGRTGTCLSGAGYFPAAARIGWGPVMVMIKRVLALLGSGALAILLLRQAETAAQAVRDGVQLCLTSVIPALFPFFAVSSLLVALGAAEAAGRALARPFRRLFRCGGAGCAALLLGLVGGYPVGARTAAELVRRGELSPAEGARLLTFCNNAGPAFSIGVAGVSVFGSARTGVWLYLLHCAAALLTGLLFCRRPLPVTAMPKRPVPPRAGLTGQFLRAVEGAVSAMARVCGFVVFFLVLLRLAEGLIGPLPPLAAGVLELTNGILRLTPDRRGFVTAAALLGWGGLSVHCQTAAVTAGSGISLRLYVPAKAVQAALSAGLAALLAPYLLP